MDHRRLVRRAVFADRSYPAAAQRLTLADEVDAHTHDFIEIAVVLDGTGRYEYAGGAVALRTGVVCAVRPGQWHAYRECTGLDVINVYLGAELINRDLSWVLDHPHLAGLVLRGGISRPMCPASLGALVGWLTRLCAHRSVLGTPSAAMAVGLVSCALAELAAAPVETDDERPVISPVVRRALQLIGDDPAHPWRMEELADRLHLSVPHLHRLFAAEVGVPPITWLARTRAERAAGLLLQTDLPIAEVGGRAGWPDASYFSRQFRSLQGLSPSAYRRRFRAA